MTTSNTNNLKKQNQCMTHTADVTNILKALNNQSTWKSQTNKLLNTLMGKTYNQQPPMISQAEIDLLFDQKHKLKIKTETKNESQNKNKNKNKIENLKHPDYLKKINFLKIDDDWDRLLTGLLDNTSLDLDKISDMFSEDSYIQDASIKIDLTQQFKKKFLVGRIVGEGAYASVRVAVYKSNNQKVAIKVYEKAKLKELQRKKSVRRQIKILQNIDHPNVLKIIDVIETNNHVNIIMEYLSGISLSSYLKNQKSLKASQKNCRKIFGPLFEALTYLHSKNIAHRDIKLENIILDENLSPKLIDFGFSTCIQKTKKVKIFCGTPSYMAPQIIQKKQYRGQEADIWALGVLLYVSLTGIFPFKGSTDQQLYRKINNAQYNKENLPSAQSIDLISKMLKINPQQRISAFEILNHPWITLKTNNNDNGNVRNKTKRIDSLIEPKKRITSINKSKDDNLAASNAKRMIQTCKDNLKMQLRLARESLLSNEKARRKQQNHHLNLTQKFIKVDKSGIQKTQKGQKQNCKQNRQKKEKQTKGNSKILDLLKLEMRKKQEDKSKGKIRRA